MDIPNPEARTQTQIPANAAVPLTLEGSWILHQMMRLRWGAWKALPESARGEMAGEAASAIGDMEKQNEGGQSAVFSLVGHKGDLLFVHFRRTLDGLNSAELRLAGLRLAEYMEPITSYVSVIELSLYESSAKLYKSFSERDIEPGSPEWMQEAEETLERQRKAMAPRLFPPIPPHRYICFYPMDRKRGESKNWYTVPLNERQRMMHEHGLAGRKYAGAVKQIISGSIGFDDWEWGVDLFADDPVVFKQLIYEMRFDEVSAVYALFGPFCTGIRVAGEALPDLLRGKLSGHRWEGAL